MQQAPHPGRQFMIMLFSAIQSYESEQLPLPVIRVILVITVDPDNVIRIPQIDTDQAQDYGDADVEYNMWRGSQ